MTRLNARARRIASILTVRNFRLFFIGQVVSVSGTWMQRVAQSWLVLDLTGSGTAVGIVTSLQYIPILVLAPYGGLLADRIDKRKILFVTQSVSGLLAVVLGLLVITNRVELWMVYGLAFLLGISGSFDNPARQSFVMEMVGRDKLTNAVGLNSVLVNAARIFGPALAGLLIVTVGIGICFLLNAASYLALVIALLLMRPQELHRVSPLARGRGLIRESVAYLRSNRQLVHELSMIALISVFAYEFDVILPLLSRFTFGGDADTLGIMFSAMGIGALVGGLHTASRVERPDASLARVAMLFAISMGMAALAPALWVELIALTIAGATGTSFLALCNATVQLDSRPEMRGRILALWTIAFLGVRPIGAIFVGWVGERIGPRYGMATGAVSAAVVALWAYLRRTARSTQRQDAFLGQINPEL